MRKRVTTKNAPPPAPFFSQGVISGNLIFTAGQIPLTSDGVEAGLIVGTIEEQTHQVIKNLQAILEEAGSGLDKVIKVTIYLTDMSVYGAVNKVYAEYFTNDYPPVREAVGVKELPLGAEIEMSVFARV